MSTLQFQAEIIQVQGFFIGMIWRDGLFANSEPKTDFEAVLTWLEGFDDPVQIRPRSSKNGIAIAEYIVNIWQGNQAIPVKDLQIDYHGLSKHTKHVLEVVRHIPSGTVLSYGQVAIKSNLPKAARFVGNVMAHNRFPLLIPCHRVVRKDGIGSYGIGGSAEKVRLIQAEKQSH